MPWRRCEERSSRHSNGEYQLKSTKRLLHNKREAHCLIGRHRETEPADKNREERMRVLESVVIDEAVRQRDRARI
jgi:hypothetical protein